MRVFPIADVRGPRVGECRLCPHVGALSKTHVPAKRAGNDHDFRAAVRVEQDGGGSELSLGRPSQGGMWGYWFCERCNNATGVWDEAYIEVHRHLVLMLHDAAHVGQDLVGQPTFDVGAFVRAMWAWAFALVPGLKTAIPDVAEGVRTGAPCHPPTEIDLYLAVTMSLRVWVTSQPQVAVFSGIGNEITRTSSGLIAPGPPQVEVPTVVVGSPPFNVVFGHGKGASSLPHMRVTEWLLDPAGTSRPVALALPLVDVRKAADVVRPITYDDLRRGVSRD